MEVRTARRTKAFTESVIRTMTRVARESGAINLAQGFPDFPAPQLIKDAACAAIQGDVNQYAITWGTASMRTALEKKYKNWYGMEVDGEREVTVTCGATEAMVSVMMALVNPGDEVIVMEPFYENYGPGAILCEAAPVFLTLEGPDFLLDPTRLEALITSKTRAIVINTPNNPSGRVFTLEELQAVAHLCQKYDLIAITDEIYEHILYEGQHICLATLPGMRERTVVISGASKTFCVTGWRIGTIIAPPDLTAAIRKVHDFLTVGAPAPLQEACAEAMNTLGSDYYESMRTEYSSRGDVLVSALIEAGFACRKPQGAYYVMADFSALDTRNDTDFSTFLAKECGVIPVPGSSFFKNPSDGRTLVRFAFCKKIETLEAASAKLRGFFGG